MKLNKLVIAILLICFSVTKAEAEVLSIPEGAYKGKTIYSPVPHLIAGKLFLVVANGHITGFTGPNNNLVLATVFNQTELDNNEFKFTLNKSTLKFKSNDPEGPKGTARFQKTPIATPNQFKAYYSNDSGLFVNIGPDGSTIIVSSSINGTFFGKVDSNGKFTKIFGPKDKTISGHPLLADSYVVTVTSTDASTNTIVMKKSE